MGLNRGYTPWRPEVSPFNQDFRDLVNQNFEAIHRYELIEESINRVLVERFPSGGQASSAKFFTARIRTQPLAFRTDTPTGLVIEWVYDGWDEVIRDVQADTWIVNPDGRNDSTLGPARNLAEQPDPADLLSRWHGSGHNLDQIPRPDFSLSSIREGTIVANFHTVSSPGELPEDPPIVEVWFDRPNQIQGACPA